MSPVKPPASLLAFRFLRTCLAAAAALAASAGPAWAHASDRGMIMLLPTDRYLVGGALVVAVSFALLALSPDRLFRRAATARLAVFTIDGRWRVATSLAAFLFFVGLLATGIAGSRDPLSNPLTLTVWTLWWVGVTLLHGLFGNLWAWINPWIGPYRLLRRLVGGAPPLRLPQALGYWPAVIAFAGFAWFEQVDAAPDDPERLAIAATVYWVVTFVGMLLFGQEAWLGRAECFSVFYRIIARVAPLSAEPAAAGGPERRRLVLRPPGAAILDAPPLPPSGLAFLLLTLSSVSAEDFNRTFLWLGLFGVNPLEYPGRSETMVVNSIGMVTVWAALIVVFAGAVALGHRMAGRNGGLAESLGRLALTIAPISLAFHLAHYVSALMVNGQYALLAASDPFGHGADLLGLGDFHVTTSFQMQFDTVQTIWNLQAAAIVGGHVLAIYMAHLVALRLHADGRRATLSQLPLAVVMVLYTLFGLWLLATPIAA